MKKLEKDIKPRWRALWDVEHDRWAPWLHFYADRSGVYLLRRIDATKKAPGYGIEYIGHSRTGRLTKTLQRHFQRWKGRTAATQATVGWPANDGWRASPEEWEAMVRPTMPRLASRLERKLIGKFDPPGNIQSSPQRTEVARANKWKEDDQP